MTFEEQRNLVRRLNPYTGMHQAISWASRFIYALTHPDATEVLDADVASEESIEGFNYCRNDWECSQP